MVKDEDSKQFSYQYSKFLNLDYLSSFPFYSRNDRWFRFLRDQYLTKKEYHEIMNELMIKKSFNINNAKNNLWMSELDLLKIENEGHILGLHSYSHPTKMSKLTKSEQESEYKKNNYHLTKLIKKPIKAMSHPCGDYSNVTLDILKNMNIEIGFRSEYVQ